MKNSVKSHQASECSLIFISACDEGPGLCAHLITFLSILLVFVTIPFSLCFAVKVVQEYERVVIFRLGRLLAGGARGPGIFFIVPCVDSYQKVDMRTLTFDVPPQEVRQFVLYFILLSTYIYGITGCGIFKAGMQNWKGFCIKINCCQMKLLNSDNRTNREPQQLAKISVFKVDYFDFSCKKIE